MRRFRAPGRVNLIGEHTDYNLGFVLPIALDLETVAERTPSPDGKLRVTSELRQETVVWDLAYLSQATPARHWSDYPLGVARELVRAGCTIEPAEIVIRSTVPVGGGLSSSASLEVACALAMLGDQKMDRLELARLCQRAEVEFVGLPCGIMDQYVSLFGAEHAALRIDCRSLTHQVVPLPNGVEVVAVNTMVKHELGASAYKERTLECATAVQVIRRRHPSVHSLRDLTAVDLEELMPLLPPLPARRARHVVTENERVEDFVDACRQGDREEMGSLLYQSHRSLAEDYEVSCDELDFLVSSGLGLPGVFGARMTGGGFGGSIVALMRPEVVSDYREKVTRAYQQRFHVTPAIHVCRAAAGAGEVPA